MEIRIKDLSADLHARFKILCVREHITMNTKLIQIIQEAVEKGEKKHKKRGISPRKAVEMELNRTLGSQIEPLPEGQGDE